MASAVPEDLPVDLDAVLGALRSHGVSFALLFGSRADGTAVDGSDVDLAVWAPTPMDWWTLGGALGETVDLVDLVDLRTAPDGLAGRIAITGVVVLDDDPPARIRWQAETRKRHLDEAFRRRRFQLDFVQAHR